MPPWGFFYAYRTAVYQLESQEGVPSISAVAAVLKRALRMLDPRWNAAGEIEAGGKIQRD